ncbi:hypothetical protein FACS1894124_5120 [Spirochaetia bacterium]|nr:hypothetical protein FACS1894124_5120 [Spirochaetia bacterium]
MKDGWYCLTNQDPCVGVSLSCTGCSCYRRKHETPEQFKDRTGRVWPDDGAVYYIEIEVNSYNKKLVTRKVKPYKDALKDKGMADAYYGSGAFEDSSTGSVMIICANTDFGPPEGDFEEVEEE